MARKQKLPSGEDGTALWRHVAQGVKPLKKRVPPVVRNDPGPEKSAIPTQSFRPAHPEISIPIAKHKPRSLSHGTVADLDKRTGEKLRRGRLPVEARLDLHGMTQAEAHHALVDFIAGRQASGCRCVIVITGKGSYRGGAGILKEAVPRWLNEPANRQHILAFSHAQPKDGGTGALYILLRRSR
jgi:DNA-nicking Smr family endonuclease